MKPLQDDINVIRTLFLNPKAPCHEEAWQVFSANVYLTIAITAFGCLYFFTNGGDVGTQAKALSSDAPMNLAPNYILLGFLVLLVRENTRSIKEKLPYFRYIDCEERIKDYRTEHDQSTGDDSTILTAAARDDRAVLTSVTGIPLFIILISVGVFCLETIVANGFKYLIPVWSGGEIPYNASYGSAYFQIVMSFGSSIMLVAFLGIGIFHGYKTWKQLSATLHAIYVPLMRTQD